jgi:hypothetical protein
VADSIQTMLCRHPARRSPPDQRRSSHPSRHRPSPTIYRPAARAASSPSPPRRPSPAARPSPPTSTSKTSSSRAASGYTTPAPSPETPSALPHHVARLTEQLAAARRRAQRPRRVQDPRQ